jgi:hypothetical protein
MNHHCTTAVALLCCLPLFLAAAAPDLDLGDPKLAAEPAGSNTCGVPGGMSAKKAVVIGGTGGW